MISDTIFLLNSCVSLLYNFPSLYESANFYESANSIVVVSEKQNRHSLPELRLGPFAGQAYVGMSSGLGVHAADSMASEPQGSWAQCMSQGLGRVLRGRVLGSHSAISLHDGYQTHCLSTF